MSGSLMATATTGIATSANLLPAFTFLAKATLLLCGALAISALLRRASAGARHLVWLGTLVAVLLLPVLSRWAPLKLEVLPTSWVARTSDTQGRVDMRDAQNAAATPNVAQTSTGVEAEALPIDRAQHDSFASSATINRSSPSLPAYSVWAILFAAWVVIAIALTAWIAAGAVSVARIVSGARPLVGHRWEVALCEVADRLDLSETPRLLASEHIEMPFACGVLRPTIVLPTTAESWSEDRRRAVLFHELAHVRRRDLIGHTLGRIACALYWFHPLVWTAAKRLRAESERACDDLVLSCGARASEYADHLLDMVTSVRHHAAPAMALPMARRREFEGRMLAILDPQVQRVGPGRLQTSMLILSLSALSLCVAAMAPSSPDGTRNESRQSPAVTAASAMKSPSAAASSITSVANPAAPAAPNGPAPVDAPAAIQLGGDQRPADAARAFVPVVEVDTPPPSRVALTSSASDTSLSNPERVAILRRLLRADPDASVRKAAAWGLEPVASEEATVNVLAEALATDKDAEVREMAAWALAGSSRSSALRVLIEALRRDTESEVRATAVWALGQKGARADQTALEAALRDESSEVRETAAWALGESELSRAPAALIATLSDRDDEVRLTAAWALGQIQDQDSRSALLTAFASEKNAEVRRAELRALAFMGERSQSLLDKALASDDAELRQHAVRMLAGHGVGSWPWPWPRPDPRPSP